MDEVPGEEVLHRLPPRHHVHEPLRQVQGGIPLRHHLEAQDLPRREALVPRSRHGEPPHPVPTRHEGVPRPHGLGQGEGPDARPGRRLQGPAHAAPVEPEGLADPPDRGGRQDHGHAHQVRRRHQRLPHGQGPDEGEQGTPRGGVGNLRRVSHRVDPREVGGHAGVREDAPIRRHPHGPGQIQPRPDPRGEDHPVRLQEPAVLQTQPPGLHRRGLDPREDLHLPAPQGVLHHRRQLRVQGGHHVVQHLHQGHRHTPIREGLRRLQADGPAAHHHDPVRPPRQLVQVSGVPGPPEDVDVLPQCPPRHQAVPHHHRGASLSGGVAKHPGKLRKPGSGPGSEDQGLVGDPNLSVPGHHLSCPALGVHGVGGSPDHVLGHVLGQAGGPGQVHHHLLRSFWDEASPHPVGEAADHRGLLVRHQGDGIHPHAPQGHVGHPSPRTASQDEDLRLPFLHAVPLLALSWFCRAYTAIGYMSRHGAALGPTWIDGGLT